MKKILRTIPIIILGLIFTFCSSKNPGELYNSAMKNINEKKYTEAVSELKKIVNENAKSKLEAKAIYKLAKLYHGHAIKSISQNKSLQEAVKYYKLLYKKYPNFEGSAGALFMAGFIQANELQNYKAAKETYNQFIKSYPKSELITSAKEEIKNLGVPPADILKNKISK